jgi:hypothetical protein
MKKIIDTLIQKLKKTDAIILIKIELIIELDFESFGQIRYIDENGRPWINEFFGNFWSKEFFVKQKQEINCSVFVNNQYLQKGRKLKLIQKINGEVIGQKEFSLSSEKIYSGWFHW